MVILSTLALWASLLHLALALTPPLVPLESVPGGAGNNNCVNTRQSRGCWKGDFNIYTDYDARIPKGRLREYHLTLSEKEIAVDGYHANKTVFNGQYPGPLIEADWGDTIRVTVHNNLTNFNGTAVHWHGIRMFETNWQDGVPGVTQCPIKPGSSQTYEFRAMQYGSSWYHSHFSLQYTNGAYGPLVIHGPSSANWDVDLGPWLISDWYHDDAFRLLYYEFQTDRAAIPNSMVLNGKGRFNCSTTDDPRCTGRRDLYTTVFQQGTKYKIAIANTGTLLTETFWIDGHNFTVIANDFVPIEPYETNVITLGIGQRYEIVVEANADLSNGTDFWIHSHFCGLPELLDSRVGIIRYRANSTADPPTGPPAHVNYGCADPAPGLLKPIVRRQVGNRVNSLEPSDYLKIGLQHWPNVSDPNSRIHRWTMRNVPMQLDWRQPSLKKLTRGGGSDKPSNIPKLFPPETEPTVLDYETGEWVYFVITNNYTVEEARPPRTLPQSVHPIHLHGHDLVVLAQGDGPFTTDVVPQLNNPARRDVVNCPIGGYVWIAFQIDNPGAWLIHCHIAWHASSGFALQFIEQPGKIKKLLQKNRALGQLDERCDEWSRWYTTVNEKVGAVQEDSGV
ncbi:multicopper oxidase [Parathielavia appendiculata]|uniref:Multicopper oxidase n=1 Tax=Parathielavia appendiculata TaxID=2587402 RepID=A0AAN6TQY4_9PEZI|nr:multicopper oxidase [Parathielavia appendiculata]